MILTKIKNIRFTILQGILPIRLHQIPGEIIAGIALAALTGMLSLMVAGFLLIARVFQLGFPANFFFRTVLVGFLTGICIQVLPGLVIYRFNHSMYYANSPQLSKEDAYAVFIGDVVDSYTQHIKYEKGNDQWKG